MKYLFDCQIALTTIKDLLMQWIQGITAVYRDSEMPLFRMAKPMQTPGFSVTPLEWHFPPVVVHTNGWQEESKWKNPGRFKVKTFLCSGTLMDTGPVSMCPFPQNRDNTNCGMPSARTGCYGLNPCSCVLCPWVLLLLLFASHERMVAFLETYGKCAYYLHNI